ncbi:MAG: DUF1735 domain-containing protein [Ferruginibacter sp.]
MKKIIVSSLSIVALAILGTGCLKDKGFEDQNYGLQVPDSRAVSFPQSRSASSVTYGVLSSITPLDIAGPVIALEAPGPQSSDTRVTLQINDALVTADPDLTLMPASEYTIDLNRVIEAGQSFDSILVTLPHSANLDPNLIYGIGLSITSADNNFDVASNMKDLVLRFTVKNKYDGVYDNTGTFVDNTNPAFTDRYPLEYRLVTTGPASVDVQLNVNGSWDPAYLFFNGTGGSFYGNYGLTMSFDPADDHIIEVHNYYGDQTKAPTAVGDPSQGSGAPTYVSGGPQFRSASLDPSGLNVFDDDTDPDNPVIYIKHWMFQQSFMGGTSPRVELDETWTRTGDRP